MGSASTWHSHGCFVTCRRHSAAFRTSSARWSGSSGVRRARAARGDTTPPPAPRPHPPRLLPAPRRSAPHVPEACSSNDQLSTVVWIEVLLVVPHSAAYASQSYDERTVLCSQAITARSCGVVALPGASASRAADAYTIPAVRVRIGGIESQAIGGASAKPKGVARQQTAHALCHSTTHQQASVASCSST